MCSWSSGRWLRIVYQLPHPHIDVLSASGTIVEFTLLSEVWLFLGSGGGEVRRGTGVISN